MCVDLFSGIARELWDSGIEHHQDYAIVSKSFCIRAHFLILLRFRISKWLATKCLKIRSTVTKDKTNSDSVAGIPLSE